jgi:flagellar biosynthesis protein FlhB
LTDLRLRMDLQWFAGEKSEPATPKKKQDARKKGQVAKSMELPSALILFFAFLFFLMFGGFMKERIFDLFTVSLNQYMLLDLSQSNVLYIFRELLFNGLIMLSPIMIGVVIIGIVGNYMQFGFLLTGEPLMMKLNKINPLEGAKRLFSMRALVDFLKSILKLTIVAIVAYTTVIGERSTILILSSLPIENLFTYAAGVTINLGLKICAVLICLAIFDFMYQKYEHAKNLRMSKQDIKDEYKKTEGDPLIKGKIREKQRRMAMQRMMQEIPNADVVITNPTHFAVAIRYDSKEMEAPLVIAKGQDYVALKIKELAKKHDIILMENKPLARALFAKVEIGQHVPNDLFQAVAEVLAYVYRIKRKI